MTLGETLIEVWKQVLVDGGDSVMIAGSRYPVGRTRSGLRFVALPLGGRTIDGVEQNPEKGSRWAELARSGKRVMQFRTSGRYIANVCEGVLTRYPLWRSLGLPE